MAGSVLQGDGVAVSFSQREVTAWGGLALLKWPTDNLGSCMMRRQDFFETDPNEQLRQAWKECLAGSLPHAQLPISFHEKIRTILDETKLTKKWSTKEVDRGKVHFGPLTEIRGPLKYLEPWRGAFWRRTVAGLLLKAQGITRPPIGKAFWDDFQDEWCDSESLGLLSPIRPSRARPRESGDDSTISRGIPYAINPAYIEWAKSEFRARLKESWPRLFAHISDHPYDPADDLAVERHACVLSAVSILTITEYLNLNSDEASLKKIIDYFAKDATNTKSRFRQKSVWPGNKPRAYVELHLSTIYAQVLEFRENDWLADPLAERHLSFSGDGYEGNQDRDLRIHLLRRFDIEMAVWCEGMSRWLMRHSSESLHTTNTTQMNYGQDTEQAGLSPLMPHQRKWAETIIDAGKRLACPTPSAARFSMPEDWSLDDQSRYLAQTEWQLEDGITILPRTITTPVLEGDLLTCNLGWDIIAPDSEWVDTHLLVLINGESHYLDYDGPGDDQPDDEPVVLRLQGSTWEQIQQRFDVVTLINAFAQATFAYRASNFQTGFFVLGVITLTDVDEKS